MNILIPANIAVNLNVLSLGKRLKTMNKWIILENHLLCPYCGDEYAFECLITKTTWENGETEYVGGYFCPNCGKKLREQGDTHI